MTERLYLEYHKDGFAKGQEGETWTAWWGGREIALFTHVYGSLWCVSGEPMGNEIENDGTLRECLTYVAGFCN